MEKNEVMNCERIKLVINEKCAGNRAQFARELGESAQTISTWMNRNVGYGILNKILTKYPDINKEWLITGNGNMYGDNVSTNIVDQLLVENKALREEIQELTAIIKAMVAQGAHV